MVHSYGRNIERDGIEPEVQRRILDRLNKARRPEDIPELDDPKVPKEIRPRIIGKLRELGAFGFTDLRQVAEIRGFNKEILDHLVFCFGPSHYGQWSMPYDTQMPDGTPFHVAHAAVLRTGRVLFLPESTTKTTMLWDPSDEVNPQFEFMINQPDEYLFCSGHAFLSDGRLLVAGGGGGGPSNVNRAWKFDPVPKTWEKTAGDMSHPRWYPTVVTLGDEHHVLVVGGAPGIGVSTIESYSEALDSFSLLTGADATRSFPQLYPGLHLLPSGEVFYSRTGFGSAGQGPGGGDPVPGTPYLKYTPPTTGEWVEIDNLMEYPDRVRGMSVILLDPCDPAIRVMIIGGTGLPGSETAEIIDLSKISPTWEHPTIIPGGESRTNVNAVLLPDGTVFVCGGTSSTTPPCALYNPSTNVWSEMASVNYRKQYHSVAVLLPSGKVMATGGSNYGGGSSVIEIFSPPYLFKGPRPEITTVPDLVHHAQKFTLETPQAADIEKVVLVRPMAVTHQTDSEQRVVQLTFLRNGNSLDVSAPNGDHPHAVPRGYYMLFILNTDGVPSEGKFIHLH